MIKKKELLKTPEYWFETTQNEIYRQVSEFLENNDEMNQTKLAEKLGVTKGYVSQVLNGNFNYTLKKLIELSLAINKVPVIEFKDINEFVENNAISKYKMDFNHFMIISNKHESQKYRSVVDGDSQMDYNYKTFPEAEKHDDCKMKVA